MTKFETLQKAVAQTHTVSRCYWKSDAESHGPGRDAISLQFVLKKKKEISRKHNKVKHNKRRYACSYFIITPLSLDSDQLSQQQQAHLHLEQK